MNEITEDLVDRNIAYLKEHLERHLKLLLSNAVKLIDNAFSGLLAVFRVPAKVFFYAFVRNDIKRNAITSINFVLDLTKRLVMEGVEAESDKFYDIVEEEFPKWLSNDHILQHCRKVHKNYERTKGYSKIAFEWQVIPLMKFISITDSGVKHYPDLCRATFEDPLICQHDLDKQLDAIKEGLEVAGEDVSIFKVPFFKRTFHTQLSKLFDTMMDDMHEDIKLIYNHEIDDLYRGYSSWDL